MTRLFGNPWLLLTLAPLLWGGNSVAGKLAAEAGWQPFTLTALRWGLAAALLTVLAWRAIRRERATLRRQAPLLGALGASMCLFNLTMYLALTTISAINVSIEQASMPLLIMIANFVLLGQRVRALQLVGLALTIAGVVVVATDGRPATLLAGGLAAGDAIMLLGCVFYAAYTFGLRWRPPLDWLAFMWAISLGAFLTALPFALWELSREAQGPPEPIGWAVLAYVVVFPTFVSQIAYARGVELIGGNRAGLFINLVPVFGSLLAVLLLGEHFGAHHALGMVLVLGGIALAERVASRAAGVGTAAPDPDEGVTADERDRPPRRAARGRV